MEKKHSIIYKIIKEVMPYIFTIAFVIVVKMYIISPIKVNGDSMMKTLHDGDIMLLNIIGYKIDGLKRFDIVVVDDGEEWIIKRVIGLPGEKIEYKDNVLYINGEEIEDNYASEKTEDFSFQLSDSGYYVLGDNRTNSKDSRFFGEFNTREIKGKTNVIVFPFKRFGSKK